MATMSGTPVRDALYFVEQSKTISGQIMEHCDSFLSVSQYNSNLHDYITVLVAERCEASLSLAEFAFRVTKAQLELARELIPSRHTRIQEWEKGILRQNIDATPTMNLPAMKQACVRTKSIFGVLQTLPRIWQEIEKQMSDFKMSSNQFLPAQSATDNTAQKKEGEASSQVAQAMNQQNPTPSTTPSNASKLPTNVIEAFHKGDINALKKALGGGPTTPQPKTLQEQINHEYPINLCWYGPWGVPLPVLLDPNTDLDDSKEAIRNYLGGLTIVYGTKRHNARIALPEEQRSLPPTPTLAPEMISKFWRANGKLWKWVETMQERKEVIPWDVWVGEQVSGKEERYKAMVRGYIDKLNGKKAYGDATKASARSQKRAAEDTNEGDNKGDQGDQKRAKHE